MKFTMKLLLLALGALILASVANAASPREQLKQMVEQLQKSPNDDALREKIIKLARTIKPAPAVPEEASRRMDRGTAAFESSKSAADYKEATKEFELATLAAPWYGDAYFNLGVAQDKSENYEAALRSLKFALLASPDSKDIKQLINKVEYRNEKANAVVAAFEQEKKTKKEFIERLDGAQWLKDGSDFESFCVDGYIEIHRSEIFTGLIVTKPAIARGCEGETINGKPMTLGVGWYTKKARVEGRQFVFDDKYFTDRGTISEDGETLVIKSRTNPSHPSYPKEWTSTYNRVKNPRWTIVNP